MVNNFQPLPILDKLAKKIYAYYQTIWREKWEEGIDEDWLSNFADDDEDIQLKERVNMLYLLSKFMYFGNKELRQLILSLFRDLYKYPIVASIRRANNDTIDVNTITALFNDELDRTRFLGVGNPSESGVHLLYYFRQECRLSKKYFINSSEIFLTNKVTEKLEDGSERNFLKTQLRDSTIKRYIFIDDFCGSGTQAKDYLGPIVENLKFEDPDIEVSYLMLFGTEYGINQVKAVGLFDNVNAVYTIDESFKAFSDNSRYYVAPPDEDIERDFARDTINKYGPLMRFSPFGYRDCQLLIGLFHNTPDNTLPIFWTDANSWKPIFKRYHKIY